MAVKIGPQYYLQQKLSSDMNDVPNESFKYYNMAAVLIANDIYKHGKISAARKAWMKDTAKLHPKQIKELQRIADLLLDNKVAVNSKKLQSSKNFGTLFKFGNTTYGRRFIENICDIKKPKFVDWYGLFEKLIQQTFDFENSVLLENCVELGEQIENAFQNAPKLEN